MYEKDFKFEDGVLHVRLAGEFPMELLDSGANLFQELADACTAHDCDKAVVDARELRVDLGTLGLFRAGEDISGMSRLGVRVAFIARAEMIDPFFENVAANRGGNIGVFTEIDDARQWLALGDAK